MRQLSHKSFDVLYSMAKYTVEQINGIQENFVKHNIKKFGNEQSFTTSQCWCANNNKLKRMLN